MKLKITIIILIISILLLLPLLWIDHESFDIYRFTEEWYKTIVQLILITVVVNWSIVWFNKELANYELNKYIVQQDRTVKAILYSLDEKDDKKLVLTLKRFVEIHTKIVKINNNDFYAGIWDYRTISETISFITDTDFSFTKTKYSPSIQNIETFFRENYQITSENN